MSWIIDRIQKKERAWGKCDSGGAQYPNRYTINDLKDLQIGQSKNFISGCGNDAANDLQNVCGNDLCLPNVNEFRVGLSDIPCYPCLREFGCSCTGADRNISTNSKIPNITRVAYTADPSQCCLLGVATIGNTTCDPQYRNKNSNVCMQMNSNECLKIPANINNDPKCKVIISNPEQTKEKSLLLRAFCSIGDNLFNFNVCKDWVKDMSIRDAQNSGVAISRTTNENTSSAVSTGRGSAASSTGTSTQSTGDIGISEAKSVLRAKCIGSKMKLDPCRTAMKNIAEVSSEFDDVMISYCRQNPTDSMCQCLLSDINAVKESGVSEARGPPACVDIQNCLGGDGKPLVSQFYTKGMNDDRKNCKNINCVQVLNIGNVDIEGKNNTITSEQKMYCGVEEPKSTETKIDESKGATTVVNKDGSLTEDKTKTTDVAGGQQQTPAPVVSSTTTTPAPETEKPSGIMDSLTEQQKIILFIFIIFIVLVIFGVAVYALKSGDKKSKRRNRF